MVVMVILTLIGLSVPIIVSSLSNTEESKSLRLRREWRTLTKTEKELYIDAAVCLTQTPSRRDPRVTIHDDFSYLHGRIGNYSHNAAPFLPWHRYFIHSYEKALKDHCGFKGTLPYWDWSKDYKNVLESPIWDIDPGFGPNGDMTGPEGVSHGHCVRNGSFAKWTPAYYQGDYRPHCLSRGFFEKAEAEERSRTTVKPEILEAVIAKETDFFRFTMNIEDVSHITVPYLVHGDFRRITASNDRLWWSWQKYSGNRFLQYNGPARYDTNEEASLTDLLDYGGILPFDPSVGDLMDTEGDLLRYRYDTGAIGDH
ncbi:hypothetical protein N7478_013303 [Penicillium angulare]|uniref:uncharacterized protein n=1 Tax=Penicillium angulare TaxID=116970 RepID=UPI002541C187|nr:uncharacterized protein N7478_013303 [Penicillium angulare]KAJ5257199.1 hypothetical protein N7478_013303 [Penicillium angulare]